MKIAKKFTKIHVFWKIAFLGWNYAFYPQTKVVLKTWSYCKTDEKIKFSKLFSLGGVRGSWIRSFWDFFAIFGTPQVPQKIFFLCKFFYHETKNSSRLLELLLFWEKSYFWPPKGSFPKNMDFGTFPPNFHIIKAPNWNCAGIATVLYRICGILIVYSLP